MGLRGESPDIVVSLLSVVTIPHNVHAKGLSQKFVVSSSRAVRYLKLLL